MRTPSLFLPVCLCVFTLGLAGCGGGGGGGGAPGEPQVLYTVTNHNNAGAGSLRHAVNNAPDGAWIVFDPALGTGTITLQSPIVIDRNTVIGGLAGDLGRHTISGNNATRLFEVDGGVTLDLRDLILSQGNGGADPGGGIYTDGGTLLLSRTSFVSCHAQSGGGGAIRIVGGTLVMADCAVTACTAKWGGAISASDTLGHIERCSFFLNTATVTTGGAMHLISVQFAVVNSTLDSNSATDDTTGVGGAIGLVSHGNTGPAQLVLWASTVSNNTADSGGAIYARSQDGEDCHLICSYSIVAENNATSAPDLLFVDGADAEGVENVIGVADGAFFWNGFQNNHVGDNITPLDPGLQAVAFHSYGRVKRHLSPGSPALNSVSTAAILRPNGAAPLLLDQEGGPRPEAGAPDIGAIEQ